MKRRIEIFFAEDHKLSRQTIIPFLEEEGIFTIGEAENGKTLLKLLEKKLPDLVLLDLQMPVMDGNEALLVIRKKWPGLKVIILSAFNERSVIEDLIEKGASAFVTKNMDVDKLIDTIKDVFYGKVVSMVSENRKSIFTKRDKEIIPLICAGKTNKEIAEVLFITEKAVEANRKKLYEKTKSKTMAEFITYCVKEGLEFIGRDSDTVQFAAYFSKRN